jgi:hypothetical protein
VQLNTGPQCKGTRPRCEGPHSTLSVTGKTRNIRSNTFGFRVTNPSNNPFIEPPNLVHTGSTASRSATKEMDWVQTVTLFIFIFFFIYLFYSRNSVPFVEEIIKNNIKIMV